MAEPRSFLQELEDAVSRGTRESCLKALWHATDVLIAGRYSEDQIWTFGEVINRLAEDIEHVARVRLAKTLAPSKNAPFAVVERLAFDDSIEVAGPVLEQSERLEVRTLVANARAKGQSHLMAISQRKHIPDPVTDVLVERGSQNVVRSVVSNSGARFSSSGFMNLLTRSENDSILLHSVGMRRDIPRQVFQQLIARASEEVKRKLEHERPDMKVAIEDVVTGVTGDVHAKFGPASKNFFAAKRVVAQLHRAGLLNEDKIFEFAHSLRFNETAAAMSLLCNLPVDVVERAILGRNKETILMLVKALNFAWETTMALLFLGAPNYRITAGELDTMKVDFFRLNVATSKKVLEVYRTRKENVVGSSQMAAARCGPRI